MALYDIFSPDPAANNKQPPQGAPEGGLAYERISDTLRYVMAAIAELRDATVAKLKGMAFQEPTAVAITGGTISGVTLSNVTLPSSGGPVTATNAQQFGGMTPQQLYNFIYKVGDPAFTRLDAPPAIWPGVVATWEKRHQGRFPKMASSAGTGGVEGGSAAASGTLSGSITTNTAGAHTHGGNTGSGGSGNTGSTTLTAGQIPSSAVSTADGPSSLLIADANAYPNGNPRRLTVEAIAFSGHNHSLPGHNHSVSSDGGHNHTGGISLPYSLPIDPPNFTLHCWVRTA